MSRTTATPPLATELAIVCAYIAFGVLVAWAAPDVKAWIKGEPPVTRASTPKPEKLKPAEPKQCGALEKRATALASIVVNCLNAGHCREAR